MSNDSEITEQINQLAELSAGVTTAAAPTRKIRPMDKAHSMDWAPLHLDHPIVSMREVNLIDLSVQVFGLDEIQGSDLPVAMVIVGHGWANKARDMHPMASGLIGEARRLDATGKRRRTRDIIVVTVDQRNHGQRRRIKDGLSFKSGPSEFAKYMAIGITGGIHDHELIMNFLPGQIFPADERTVVEFMSTGFSMGGHITWRLLRQEPRIRIGVPICSVPSDALKNRLIEGNTDPLPKNTMEFYNTPCEEGAYNGKMVLAVQGGVDMVMPYELGEEKWPQIRREAAAAEVFIDEGHGHIVSKDAVRVTAEWMWRWGLTDESKGVEARR